ncbi:hypothetical protein EG68_03165 [Paragonimus skrjabini miyazakii]|uniref:Uncharacterized protein n=1 Tax=Paragonimus skrjabini miyazakii TaxID=59628 RepID=A0A8S9Y8M3_9TREM|nr:hypothetical protein EG68_03165 [Paragonimus skrjabini miyazakii]
MIHPPGMTTIWSTVNTTANNVIGAVDVGVFIQTKPTSVNDELSVNNRGLQNYPIDRNYQWTKTALFDFLSTKLMLTRCIGLIAIRITIF